MPTEQDYSQLRERLSRAVAAVCPPSLAAHKDDLVQLSLMRVMKIMEKNEGEGTFSASYLRRVAYSTLIDEIRRQRRRREVPMETDEGEPQPIRSFAPLPDRHAESRQTAEGIHQCLQTLNDDRRRSVILHLQGHSVPQVAGFFGWNNKRAENLVYRGLADLRQCLDAKGLKP